MEKKQIKDANILLAKIQSGNFDYLDIYNLIINLRESAKVNGLKYFNEVAHFIAHNEQRDRGPIKERLDFYYYRMQFYIDYQYDSKAKKTLDFKSLPSYFKRLMIKQLQEISDEILDKIGIKRSEAQTLLQRIKEEKSKQQCHATHSNKLERLVLELASAIYSDSFMQQSDFYNELIALCHKVGLTFDEDSLKKQIDKIMISVMYLMHGTKFKVDENKEGKLELRIYEKEKHESKLIVYGKITADANGKPLDVLFEIFNSDVVATTWTDESSFNDDLDIDLKTFKIKNE